MKLLAGTHSVNKTIIHHRSLLVAVRRREGNYLLKVRRNSVEPKRKEVRQF